MDFNDLTDDQKEKARSCKSVDELVALAKAEGVELTEDQLQSIIGAGN